MTTSSAGMSKRVQQLVSRFGSHAPKTLAVQWVSLSLSLIRHVKGDMDSFGHVNNVMYLRYWESARIHGLTEMLNGVCSREMITDFLSGKHTGIILKDQKISYRRPVVYPDTLTICLHHPPESVASDRYVSKFTIISHLLEEVVASGEGTIVAYDYEKGRKTALPPILRQALDNSAKYDLENGYITGLSKL